MARPPTTAQLILDGNALLYQRKNSTAWHCRFKIGKQWIRKTTGCTDRKEAIKKVQEMYFRATFNAQDGLPIVAGKSFGSVAKKVIEELRPLAVSKSNEQAIIGQLERLWIPQLGKKSIENITTEDLKIAVHKLIADSGKSLSERTIVDYNTGLMRVFKFAVQAKIINKAQIPDMYVTGKEEEPRPAFTADEFKQLCDYMLEWVEDDTQTKRQKQKRWIMLRYVYFLANTGIRPGTESNKLKWSNISYFEKNGQKYANIYVDGKVGGRSLVADSALVQLIEQIKEASEVPVTPDMCVWLLPNGRPFSDPERLFKELLEDAKMTRDVITGQERTLYSLRHYYATQQLLNGTPVFTLAKQMGTSVKMIEKTYSKLTPMLAVEQIVKKK